MSDQVTGKSVGKRFTSGGTGGVRLTPPIERRIDVSGNLVASRDNDIGRHHSDGKIRLGQGYLQQSTKYRFNHGSSFVQNRLRSHFVAEVGSLQRVPRAGD